MLKVLPILIVLLAANAYGFFNIVNNKYLLDDFHRLNNIVSISRHRRDVDRNSNGKDSNACCTDNFNNPEYVKQLYAIGEQCTTQFIITKRAFKHMNDAIICHAECTSRALKFFDENGKFNREVTIKHFEEQYVRDIEWRKAVYEEYIDVCIAEATATQKLNDGQCSNAPANFLFCFANKFLTGCPADMRSNSTNCVAIRENFSTFRY